MSNNDDDKKWTPPPSFSGISAPTKITVEMDDVGEETTRRVRAMPSISFNPTFESLSTPTAPSVASPSFITTHPGKMAPESQFRSELARSGKSGWSLADVPTLPEFHPLERTAVFVPTATASEVASRVSDILRERSIEATYDNMKAKAKCVTTENVDFRVRLYRGRNQYRHGIIVEVQRRFGYSVNFHNDTMAILDAAEGKSPSAPPANAGLPLVSDSEDDYDEHNDSVSSLEFVSTMLNHPAYDAHILALQTLNSLTDPAKMGLTTARKASKAILASESSVGAKIIAYVVDLNDLDDEFSLRLMAMSVLANSIQAATGNISGDLYEKLRPVLVKQLRDANSNPQIAYMAARCIEPLIKGHHDLNTLYDALETALVVGQSRHAALYRQAERCIKKIVSL